MKSNFVNFWLGIVVAILGVSSVCAQTNKNDSVENAIYYGEQSNEDEHYDYICYKTNDDNLSKLPNGFVVVGEATGGVSRIYESDKKQKLLLTFITAEPKEESVTILTNAGSRYQLTTEIGMRINALDNSITLIELDSDKGCGAAIWLMNAELGKTTAGLLHPGSIATFAGLAAILDSIRGSDNKQQPDTNPLPPIAPPAPASPN